MLTTFFLALAEDEGERMGNIRDIPGTKGKKQTTPKARHKNFDGLSALYFIYSAYHKDPNVFA